MYEKRERVTQKQHEKQTIKQIVRDLEKSMPKSVQNRKKSCNKWQQPTNKRKNK